MVKVVFADDHPVVRKGLKLILEGNAMLCVGEACSGQELLEKVVQLNPDVVVLDINMPGQSGIETLRELKILRPTLPVLILSMLPEEDYAMTALKAGASGYLMKDSAPDELITAIKKVIRGGRYISSSIAELLTLHAMDEGESRHGRLSPREHQVMCGIASGKPLKEIAKDLSCSPKTVSTYRQRILVKMNMKKNSDLILYQIKKLFLK
ncbi:MAG TPA: DNA-binding response regulator [Nitrospiraceae bacterium]|nr:DNA-binding response regulator [Nitrospiraceae bacterium]